MQLAIGLVLAAGISTAAYAAGSLTRSGALAAVVVGTTVYGLGDWRAAIILLAFFFTSSFWGKILQARGRRPEGAYSKGGKRDAGQVLGNGATAALLLVILEMLPGAAWPLLAFAGALAAVNADTWATELGALAPKPPRLITHLRQTVPPGTSGGVTLAGTLSALLGALLIASLSLLLLPGFSLAGGVAVAVGGLVGALLDSYLGATLQAMYRCTTEHVVTEQHPFHRCGARTVHIRGWGWLNNDWVNFACSVAGAAIACLVAAALGAI